MEYLVQPFSLTHSFLSMLHTYKHQRMKTHVSCNQYEINFSYSKDTHRTDLWNHPPMPYELWALRLSERIRNIYRSLQKAKNDRIKVYEETGVDPRFFDVVGYVYPFQLRQFHDFSFYQRIWLLLAICDTFLVSLQIFFNY